MTLAERTVGLVGLGNMGRPIAARLAAAVPLRVFDRRPDAMRAAVENGAAPADGLADLARRSDVVITLLPDDAAVRDAVDGLLDGLRPDSVLIDMGSSSPLATRALGRELAERGVAMVDAPVSGGVARAETGRLAVMVGGPPDVVAACRPLLALVAEQIFVVGALGSGHALKALNNFVSAAGLLAAGEALVIGRRFGLDPELVVDVFNASTARNNATEHKLKQFVLSRRFASGFSLALMVKDLTTALALADGTGTPAAFGVACRDIWAKAGGALDAGADHTEIVRWLETVAAEEA
jgi:3-hydroxyisobutyrate dehydrogenase